MLARSNLDKPRGRAHVTDNTPATPLNDAQLAGFLLPKVPFNKPALDVPAQVALLQRRGMRIAEVAQADHFLRFVGYYRLSGYWFPFQFRDGSPAHSDFRPGTTFDAVVDRYVFDRRLRVLTMDAIERVEIAARASISNVMSGRYGPHWYTDAQHFSLGFHAGFMQLVRREIGLQPWDARKQPEFIAHYFQNYDPPTEPPGWMVMEVLSFGAVSRMFKNLVEPEKKAIALAFGLPRARLESWFHAASHLRNLCAHHGRVWNREFGIVPSVSKADSHHVLAPKKFYNHAVALQTMLKIVSLDTHWADRLGDLFSEFPGVDPRQMGFPRDWRGEAVWIV